MAWIVARVRPEMASLPDTGVALKVFVCPGLDQIFPFLDGHFLPSAERRFMGVQAPKSRGTLTAVIAVIIII